MEETRVGFEILSDQPTGLVAQLDDWTRIPECVSSVPTGSSEFFFCCDVVTLNLSTSHNNEMI